MHAKERVDEARRLYATGLTAVDVSRVMGLPWSTVAHWCRGDRRSAPSQRTVRSACPRCTDAPLDQERYAYLLGQYLGDGAIFEVQRTCRLVISCADDWPGVRDELEAAVSAVLPTSSTSRRERTGCTDVQSHSTHWTCLFPQHGPGKKHTRPIVLEDWQQRIVDTYPGPFLRGLFHSDGCRMPNWTRRRVAGELKRYAMPSRSRAAQHSARMSSDLLLKSSGGRGGRRARPVGRAEDVSGTVVGCPTRPRALPATATPQVVPATPARATPRGARCRAGRPGSSGCPTTCC